MRNYYNCATIYLSQKNGDDTYTGYEPVADNYGGGPVKTFDKVLYMLHTMRASGVDHPITVAVMDDYYLEKPLSLGCSSYTHFFDKAHKFNNVTFTSYKDTVRIIGGKKLSGFKKDNFNGADCVSLFIPEVKDGKWKFSDLYVNGKPAAKTRYPKEGYLKAVTTEYPDMKEILYTGSKWFIAHKEDLENIDGIENSIVSFYHYWIDEHTAVESYDRQSGKLVFETRSRFNITVQYEPEHSSALNYYLENIPQTFSNPGEWYLDIPNGMLYYIPETESVSPDDIEVFAPSMQTLVNVKGSETNKTVGIRFKNLEFICSMGDYKSKRYHGVDFKEGEDSCAADEQAAVGVFGTIEFENADTCIVSDCKFNCIGGYGVNILSGCDSIRIENCDMQYIGAGGVKIYGVKTDAPIQTHTGHCVIRNNRIYKGGLRHAAACGITVCHSSHNEISDNEISYLDYSGISVGWVWGYYDNPCYGNIIRNNHIHHIGMGRLSDMGGIYLLGKQHGTVVEYNCIHDITSAHYGGWGIYTDEGSSFISVENNIVYNTKCECFHQHYGSHNTVRDNIFAFGGQSVIMISRTEEHLEAVIENNTLITDGKPIYSLKSSKYPCSSIKTSNNQLWDISGNPPVMFYSKASDKSFYLKEMQDIYGYDEHSVIKKPDDTILEMLK